MPSRVIPPNYRHVTGFYRTPKAPGGSLATESPLEFDFATLMDFDLNVYHLESQPLTLQWTDEKGRPRKYTPDFFLRFRKPGTKPWLVEVKDSQTLRKDWLRLRPKFKAAFRHASAQGWLFHIYTEKHIRVPLLKNARFLLPYLRQPQAVDYKREMLLVRTLHELREANVNQLLAACCSHPDNRASLLPHLWQMIGLRKIQCDLLRPLGPQSSLWIPEPE